MVSAVKVCSVGHQAAIRDGSARLRWPTAVGVFVRQRTELRRACAYAQGAHCHAHDPEEKSVTLGTILLIILVLLLIGAIPQWPHSRSWGYGPSGGVGVALIVVVVLLLMGRL